MNNTALWDSVCKTPTEQTKQITGKAYSGTSPKPHFLVRKATETFGPCGIGWGFTFTERVENGAEGEKLHIAHVKVWYKWDGERGEIEHVGQTMFSGVRSSGKIYTDEDAPKKSVTDGLIKALSMIGFAGDIFMGRYDDSKYVSELKAEEREVKTQSSINVKPVDLPPADRMIAAIANQATEAALQSWWDDVRVQNAFDPLAEADKRRVVNASNTKFKSFNKEAA